MSASAASLGPTVRRWAPRLAPLLGIVFFGLALWSLHAALREHHYREIVSAFDEIPALGIVQALLLAAAGYVVLIGYDLLAFRFIGRRLAPQHIAMASFLGYAFGNNVGNTLFTGAGVRYWFYSSFGIAPAEIARVVVFCSLGFWLGYLCLGAIAFTFDPIGVPAALHLPVATTRPLGLLFFVLLAGYGLLVVRRREPIRLGGWAFALPSAQLTAGQLAVATLDLVMMGATLWVLLPAVAAPTFLQFVPVFMLALVAGTVSQAPGGLGVFEAVVLVLLSPQMPAPRIVAALVAFRAIYYLAPLLLATLLAAVRQGRAHAAPLQTLSVRLGQWSRAAVPQVLAVSVFVAGALLLFSGALPAAAGRLRLLANVLPLQVVEASHFLASLVGMLLLVLARGLQRRLDAAHGLALAGLAAGIVLSLAKGLDYEEASLLALMFVALAASRAQFYRRASLLVLPLTWSWLASVAIVLAGSVWLVMFAFKHVEYSDELWWRFAFHAQAPRALRATVGAIGLAVLVAATRLLRPARHQLLLADAADLERARPIVEQSPWTSANLVFRRDKALLFSESGKAFLMYGWMRRSLIAMGDPIGPREEAIELAWQFRDLCDRQGTWPVFYEVRPEYLDLYLELGLTLIKLGEEARMDLSSFDLNGPARADLRQASAKLVRLGYRFEVLPRAAVPAALPQLRHVSDDWLARKRTREKGFSNASFDDAYLQQFPLAVVKRDDTIVAFANLWLGAQKEELSVDLMRHVAAAPNGTMDFLFAQILLWGRAEGYRWFNFGMAPLSGLEARAGAPLWPRVGRLVYRHGERFYNFRGLHHYKAKFGPVWTPRYLASPGGLALPAVLVDVAALIAGGVAGVVSKRASQHNGS